MTFDSRGRGQSSSSGSGSGGSGNDNSSTTSTSSNTTSSSSTLVGGSGGSSGGGGGGGGVGGVGVGGESSSSLSSNLSTTTTHNPAESTVSSAANTTTNSNNTTNIITNTEIPGAVVPETVSPEKLKSSFPTKSLTSLLQKISSPRWVVPVLPDQELEVLLNAAIQLSAAGVDHDCDLCVEFYCNALTTSFKKILTDEAVNSWKYAIHHCILISCGKLLHLIAIHMTRDNPYLLDLLALVFDPDNKYNTYNAAWQPECFSPPDHLWGILDSNKMFAKSPPEPKNPRGWLVDLINHFGQMRGFDNLQERFNRGLALLRKEQQQNASAVTTGCGKPSSSRSSKSDPEQENRLTLALIYSLLRPFGQCYELLTPATISKYFMPIWNVVLDLLDSFSDEELKREAKPEGRNDYINGIVKSARYLASRLPGQEELIRNLEMFRLKMILRLLQVSSFNGKMNALNEINKVLTSVTYYSHRTPQLPHCMSDDDLDWLTAERMAAWIKESDVLGIVLKDSLHQPQYVEKLEKIIRFLIKEHALTLEDLDAVWKAQAGKHEAIVKNVHDLLAKLAWDFTPEQLDHLFESFQASMTTANKRQRERLLELIRRLAEDDKNGVMAQKVLKLFWTLAHSQEIPPEVLDQALAAHVKILDYSCSQERDAQKVVWLDKCVVELKTGEAWVLPALRLIREICCLYESSPSHAPRAQQALNRQQVIERLQNEHSLVILVTNSLTSYMEEIRTMIVGMPSVNPSSLCIDGRFPHNMQISERLDFLKFLLKDGQLWLCAEQAKQIWHCLAVNAIFPSDREECFRWFGKLMGEEPDLDPGINKDFFENNILQLDPHLLTESGIKCFERFFKAVNSKEDKLKAIHRGYILDNEDLIGKDYLWRVITTGGEEIANKAIDLLKEVSTALGPRLLENIADFHEMFIGECCERLRTHYTNIMILGNSSGNANPVSTVDPDDANQADQNDSKDSKMRVIEAEKMCRILKVLQEYIKECDRSFNGERVMLPLVRATRGKNTSLYIRFQNPGRPIDDIEIITHNNEMVASFKRNLLKRIKGTSTANIKVDLHYNNGDLIDISDEINSLSQYSIRDKMILTAKLTPIGAGLASSPDTSSDSSTGSPPRPCPDMSRVESESTLPGVIISQNYQYIEFFLKLYQLGSDLEHGRLRESAKMLLHLLPCDRQTVKMLQIMCGMPQVSTAIAAVPPVSGNGANDVTKEEEAGTTTTNVVGDAGVGGGNGSVAKSATVQQASSTNEQINPQECTPEMLFLHPAPAQVHYNLCVLNSLLIPALDPFGENALLIQSSWLHSGCAHFILELLTKNNFLPNADMHTKRASFQCVLRLAKLFLYIVGCVLSRVGDEPTLCDFDVGSRSQVDILKHILTSIPNTSEITLKTIAQKLAESLAREMLSASPEGETCRVLFASTLQWLCPDISTIKSVIQLAWASSFGNLQALGTKNDFADDISMPDSQDFMVCKEALEVLTISLVLNPSANEALNSDPLWPKFITSLILKNQSRHVRQVAAEQLFLTCTYCAGDRRPFAYMVNLLVSSLKTLVPQHEATCADFFQLLCRTLSYGCAVNWPLNIQEGLLGEEIKWLQKVRESVTNTGDIQVHDDLLEGHLCLAKELMFILPPETKAKLNDLIHELIDTFLFTASREYLHLRRYGKLKTETAPPPVCRSPHTIAAACELLISLCQNCVPNMKLLTTTLIDFVCTDTDPLREWDYLPPVGARPAKGFCGLKNAGATCYMNSVLQQLYMVPSIRVGILKAEGAATSETEDFSGEPEANAMGSALFNANDDNNDVRKNYHVVILKHVQAIFAHLGHSALQFYVPRGLWTHFKLQGEPVNLREQQDAVEFFMSLFESLDEGLKALGQTQLMNATLGGSFSDQKICQECPHRYSKEEPFSVFSVDIRNHSSLTESLEQYVKGELLEGADAYHCDKCDKKVDTIKRLCVKKLPPVLAIQLKRFEYDYERVCAIKFNDYFEFPRLLDMEPYTVSGLAKLEGEVIEDGDNCQTNDECTKYELTGIVVHSGQASGGHYFSFILSKNPSTGKEQWYKFDDGEVTECKMNEDEEMKAQCFGGDYMGEVYDSNLKRMQYRRQKRWWNAYMLFYTRCDHKPIQFDQSVEQLSLAESRNFVLPLPKPIERSVRSQNIRFLHSKSIFSVEFFNFIKKLVTSSIPSSRTMTPAMEELSLLGLQLTSQFLFHTGFRTKKTLRGPVIEWYDTISHHIRYSSAVRKWFAHNALLNPPTRLGEYILIAPSPEVRTVFVKLVVFFCHFAINDEPLAGHEGNNLCEQILISVLKLLKCEVADHGKHLPHYFSLFSMYVGLGIQEKQQLLKLNVPVIFMQVALDEGPGPSIKYQYPELSKLHQVVSQLIRCSDISDKCQSSNQNGRPQPNPYKDPSINYEDLMPLSPECVDILLNRTGYIKKLIEDTNVGEEGLKLLQYCSWENPLFSRAVLTELLWQCGFAYCHDMRHHTELLLHILLIEDSWQHHRIHNALIGVAEEREGLLETIQRSKTHYQKRAYQIIKCLTQLFHKSQVALQMLNSNPDVSRNWIIAVEWLQDELDRHRGIGCQFNSYSWSPPAQSNDNTNGYMLERSHSAKNTWSMAYELCPEEEQEETNESDAEPNDEAQRQQDLQTQSTSIPTTTTTVATTKTTDEFHKEQELNQIADLIRNNVPSEEESQPQQQQQQLPQQQQQQQIGPGTSTDFISFANYNHGTRRRSGLTTATNPSATTGSPSTSIEELTKMIYPNVNGLTSNLKQMSLSPKTSVSGVTSPETQAAVTTVSSSGSINTLTTNSSSSPVTMTIKKDNDATTTSTAATTTAAATTTTTTTTTTAAATTTAVTTTAVTTTMANILSVLNNSTPAMSTTTLEYAANLHQQQQQPVNTTISDQTTVMNDQQQPQQLNTTTKT